MLREQTPACGPARDVLEAGGPFDVPDGLVPASRHAGVFAIRIRTAARRGHTVEGLAAFVDILRQAGEELVRTGLIYSEGRSSVFTLFLNCSATEVLACAGGLRPDPPQSPTDALE
ncbi:hypothetical protein F5983_36855 [Streptomyces arboris]|uniref:Uncharacterized protein n=1 Tax=Streptomyces arboris TaxID=2600619 RepID=A0A5N5EBN1_9ACTN|nr:hypothetical protein F5983_36855 [Streptomyces arboris]